ncbi:asparaginase [Roseicyclus sp. F158]|uniref:Asparaginase n=1 Tax=Tropicimonas omnivorans TaxID=3075590 RepID=A0ABU3DC60_9RHOB|nr:asparaginase [Roseicyclus sp. F158]MDT0681301.1 asparaginase [Roseicyclus sp. F158]
MSDGTSENMARVTLTRGPFDESVHEGRVAVWRHEDGLVEAWGDPARTVLPRSSVKMIQALPLIESGAAEAAGLEARHLALACASHQGAPAHTALVREWLGAEGLAEADMRCGAHWPQDRATSNALVRSDGRPDQTHNNCSGKHAGFLTLNRRLGGGTEYVEPDHPVQRAVRAAFEEVTEEDSPGYGIDGCSAPNFAASLEGIARAMAGFAAAADGAGSGARAEAQARLVHAMMAHPLLVAGEGRCCTELMKAAKGRAAVKTGAEGVFVAIIPEKRLGIALKVEDGATRAAEALIAALLVRYGILDAADPAARNRMAPVMTNWRGIETGTTRVSLA